jgi:hypothetical protein
MSGFTPFDEAGHMAQMEAGFAAFRAATAEPEPEPEPEVKRLKVRITYTVEVDQEAYADYYGIDNTAASVRADLQSLMGDATNMAPHLFDEGIIR